MPVRNELDVPGEAEVSDELGGVDVAPARRRPVGLASARPRLQRRIVVVAKLDGPPVSCGMSAPAASALTMPVAARAKPWKRAVVVERLADVDVELVRLREVTWPAHPSLPSVTFYLPAAP